MKQINSSYGPYFKDKRLGKMGVLPESEEKNMLFMLDNYDSFVYNLSAYLQELGQDMVVERADHVTLRQVEELHPDGILISPGPGKPSDAWLSKEILTHFAGEIPILGVCLGHQVIVETFGGTVKKGFRPMHGKVTSICHNGEGIFKNLPKNFHVTRYHSLTAEESSLLPCLKVDAKSEDGAVMAVHHDKMPVYGVQFHPEAVLTEYGHELLENFVKITQEWRKNHADCKNA